MRDVWSTNTGLDDRRLGTVQTAVIYQGGVEVPVYRHLTPWQWVRWHLITRMYGWIEDCFLQLMVDIDGWGQGDTHEDPV
jgi:hypothetical protein